MANLMDIFHKNGENIRKWMILTVKNLLYGLHFMNREPSAKKLRLTIKCCVISIIFGSFSCLDIVPDLTLPEY